MSSYTGDEIAQKCRIEANVLNILKECSYLVTVKACISLQTIDHTLELIDVASHYYVKCEHMVLQEGERYLEHY